MSRPSHTRTPLISCRKLVKLERCGRYEDALAEFGESWRENDFYPDTTGLSDSRAAELILRFGSLLGFEGYRSSIDHAQDRARNLLTNAQSRFSVLKDEVRVAECENHIAITYWRSNEYEEALTFVDSALSRDLPVESDVRIYSYLTKTMVLAAYGRHHENIELSLALEPDFRKYGDAFLNGSLCTNIALSYKNTDRRSEALRYLHLARSFHERSGHKIYLATVLNNLAMTHKSDRRFDLAESCADDAIKVYKKLRDKTREGSSLDTKAQVCLEAGRFADALVAADSSVAILRRASPSNLLAEALVTRAKALLRLDRTGEALPSFVEAVNISRTRVSEEAAALWVAEFAAAIKEARLSTPLDAEVPTSDLELELPSSIAGYSRYRGVRIHSDHLASFGVAPGSLAVIASCEVKRGDPVVITEKQSRLVIAGTYDTEFGLVCLEQEGQEPQLFNAEDIEILGKVVGVCLGEPSAGKATVKPIG